MVGAPSPGGGTDSVGEVAAAYAACLAIARGHYENFPVASWLLPRALRPHVAAIYAFARIADDIADEPGRADEERLRLLDQWQHALLAAHQGQMPAEHWSDATLAAAARHVFVAVPHTMRTFALPLDPFVDLLSAFRQDVTTRRYDTWDAVLDYCRRSANPVGRLMLGLAGVRDAAAERSADALCTALQLTNFWQDVAIDWSRGRLYVPLDACVAHGALLTDLDRRVIGPAWQRTLADVAARTDALFDEGRAVCDAVDGRLRFELRATWLGGRRILHRLAAADFDVFMRRPTLGSRDLVMIGWRSLTWPATRPSITRS